MSVLNKPITLADLVFPYNEKTEAREIAYSVYAAMPATHHETTQKLGSAYKFCQVTEVGAFAVPMVAVLVEIKHGPNGGLRYEHMPVRVDGAFTILRAIPGGPPGLFEEFSTLFVGSKRKYDYRPAQVKPKNESGETNLEKRI